MKNLVFLVFMLILTACNSQKKYTNFDYSYARSGGNKPFYENLWIKGNSAKYAYESEGRIAENKFTLSDETLENIQKTLYENNFRTIEEDRKKIYDHISTIIVVRKGANSASKSNASLIMEKDTQRWNNVAAVFEEIITSNINQNSEK